MPQRKVRHMAEDNLWQEWRDDIERIKQDIYELFSSRRTFRDVAEVFRGNARLQDVGSYLWDWMRVSYASYVVMRVRRETDDQGNTINLIQLLREIEARPEVITRRRYLEMLGIAEDRDLEASNSDYFTREWVGAGTRPDPNDPGLDYVDPARVAAHREALQQSVERVQEVGNKEVAHRTRVEVEDLRIAEVDEAFDAIEETLQKYYVLLRGVGLLKAEPAPQFNTSEVFTFPWIAPTDSRES